MLRRRTAPSITLAQGSTTLSQGPTGSAPGTASVYKMRLRADPHRSQITAPGIAQLVTCETVPICPPACNLYFYPEAARFSWR